MVFYREEHRLAVEARVRLDRFFEYIEIECQPGAFSENVAKAFRETLDGASVDLMPFVGKAHWDDVMRLIIGDKRYLAGDHVIAPQDVDALALWTSERSYELFGKLLTLRRVLESQLAGPD